MPTLRVEQIAVSLRFPNAAKELLAAMGVTEWADDHVVANGNVWTIKNAHNEADLSFNYDMISGKEFELLTYTSGDNWMNFRDDQVSHFGMHVSEEELAEWRTFFAERNINIAQEVDTESHTNPAIAGKRTYKYVIFATRRILGVDLKFIVRRDVPQ